VRHVGRELGVRYVLEGSVQRGGNRLRVNVQLIDAETGNHLWAERFDKPVADLFDMQDEIVSRLANALNAELVAAEANLRNTHHIRARWTSIGLSANENAGALISMMARSTMSSNQRPDTLMRDRLPLSRRRLLQRTAGPYKWVNFCRPISSEARQKDPRKPPRRHATGAAETGHNPPPAPRKNSEPFRRRTTVKDVTDP
jgi:hypothetical protein